jgi:signal transduction histidine kinase/DNA-binding response OmpR family regulator
MDAAVDGEPVNILVVDDRPDKLLAFESILESLGESVITARSGEEALQRVLEHEFAVILLDVNMPGMDGLETAAYIRRRPRTAHTPIIFVTAYSDAVHTTQGYSLGAVDYILTPVVPEVLRTKVNVFVQLQRMTRQVQRQAAQRVALAQEQAARAAAEEATSRFSFLVDLSDRLDESLDLASRTRGLARFLVPQLGELAALVQLNERGRVVRTEIAWADAGAKDGIASLAVERIDDSRIDHAVQQVMSGRPASFEEPGGDRSALEIKPLADDGPRVLELGFTVSSLGAFALRARGRMQGVLLIALRTGRRFDDASWWFANAAATRAAVMVDNSLLYEQVVEADARKNEFLAMLAHELRNPLAPIRNAVAILRADEVGERQQAWAVDVVERQVRHMVRLVDDLLDVSRITRGKIQLRPQRVSLAEVVFAAIETSRPLIESLEHQLAVDLPEQEVTLMGDPARLTQVFANLLNNAAKYTEPGGRIGMSARCEGAQAVVCISDSGIGIRPESLASIFELFAQADRTLERTQGGLGVGLTLVRRLVELHGGSVEAQSDGPGQGSQFIVRLPLADAAPAPEAGKGKSMRPNASGLRVLLVDDNADSAQTMATLLRLDGHEPEVVYDGESALECAPRFAPDAVLVDISLPGINGFDVARELRARPQTRDTLLIAMTGYGQPEDRQQAMDAGFDHHLVKPVDLDALASLFTGARR